MSRPSAPGDPRALRASGARIGAALGLALGFATFAFALPLSEASCHFPGSGSYPLFEASTVRAARTFLLGAGLGLAVGALLGAASARRLAGERGPRLATAALGLYALALRGAWGYAGPLPATGAGADAAWPVAASAVPLILAAAAAGCLWWRSGKRPPPPGAIPWIATHAVFALTAAVLATQVAYYASRAGEFVSGLVEVLQAPF